VTDLIHLGFSIRSYRDDEAIPLLVNKVFSDSTQLQYAYYDLPFVCPPTGKKHGGSTFGSGHSISLNLGEVLRGDRIMTSDYDLVMGQDVECQYLCSHTVDRKGVKWASQLVKDGYVAEWIVDNLPGATSFVSVDKSRKYYAAGFKLGSTGFSRATGKPQYFLNNHFTIVIRWRKAPGKDGIRGGKVIVGFEVYPKSIEVEGRDNAGCPKKLTGDHDGLELYIAPNSTSLAAKYPHSSYFPEDEDLDDNASLTIPYTYSVYYREDNHVEWANRWELYFSNQEESSIIHWLAILNSLVICGILTAIVSVIWGRTVQGDVKGRGDGFLEDGKLKLRSKSKKPRSGARTPRAGEKSAGGLLDQGDGGDDLSSDDESIEEITGWKLLHGDVFRAPSYGGLLAPLIGSGMQLVFMSTGLLVLSCFGILNPSFRGGFVSVGIGLFVFAGLFSGYFSGRVYKTFGGQNWRKNTLMVSSNKRRPPYLRLTFQDRLAIPWPPLQHNIHFKSIRLGSSFQHSHSFQHPCRPGGALASHSSPSRLCRELVRLRPSRRLGTSNEDECDCSPGTQSIMVRKGCPCRPPRRLDSLRGNLHRTPFRFQEHVARQEWLLLRLWFP
jgi:transmembrane 9 superfamily member 2/4